MLLERRPIGDGSGETLEVLEKLKDISRRACGCCGWRSEVIHQLWTQPQQQKTLAEVVQQLLL